MEHTDLYIPEDILDIVAECNKEKELCHQKENIKIPVNETYQIVFSI